MDLSSCRRKESFAASPGRRDPEERDEPKKTGEDLPFPKVVAKNPALSPPQERGAPYFETEKTPQVNHTLTNYHRWGYWEEGRTSA